MIDSPPKKMRARVISDKVGACFADLQEDNAALRVNNSFLEQQNREFQASDWHLREEQSALSRHLESLTARNKVLATELICECEALRDSRNRC